MTTFVGKSSNGSTRPRFERVSRPGGDVRLQWPGFHSRHGWKLGQCPHAVDDSRKIADLDAYAPTDNASELTSRTNDEGWAGVSNPGSA